MVCHTLVVINTFLNIGSDIFESEIGERRREVKEKEEEEEEVEEDAEETGLGQKKIQTKIVKMTRRLMNVVLR